MYIVRPVTMETLWGDTRLHAYQGDRAAQTIGCVYTLSGIDGIDCEIYNEKEETTLRRAVKENPAVFGLEDGEEFPLIIAFDSCAQDVSFQIHPTDTYAKEQLQLPYGKMPRTKRVIEQLLKLRCKREIFMVSLITYPFLKMTLCISEAA